MLRSGWMAVAAIVLLGVGVTAAQTPAEAPAVKLGQFSVSGLPDAVAEAGAVQQGGYYLGIACQQVMPALRAQLNLPERQGLLVGAVVPESPAAVAGIAQHDVLMRIGGKPLGDPQDLLGAVQASKGGKLKIDLIRGGKPKTIEVAPAKRPAGQEEVGGMALQAPSSGDWETVQKWLEGLAPGHEMDGLRSPMTFRIFRPGAIVPKDVLAPRPLPTNMSIVVSKTGDQPANIEVHRGGEKWEVTEKELDKLPADVRPHVEQMLGRGPLGLMGNVQTYNLPFSPPGGFSGAAAVSVPAQPTFQQRLPASGPIKQRLDEMSRRIDQLLNIVEKMADGQSHQGAPEKSKGK